MSAAAILRRLYIFILIEAVRGCTVSVGGQTYDLSALESAGTNGVVSVTAPTSEQGLYKYSASFCSDKASCQGKYGNLIRLRDASVYSCLGVYGTWSTAVNTKTTNGFEASFTSTESCSDNESEKYTSTFNFLCDKSAGDLGTLQANKVGGNNCEYSVDVHTDLVCAGSTPVGPSSAAGTLSGGSIFLIVLVCLLFVYIIVGVGLNYHKDKSFGTPHRDFWCSKLPYWTKIGCLTSWIGALSCTKGTYRWCCIKIFKADAEDEKMASSLIKEDGDDED